MACKNCKKRTQEETDSIKKHILDSTRGIQKGVIWFTIIWTLLGIYGCYSLIRHIF